MVDQRHTKIPFKIKLTYGAGQVADSLGINGVKQIGHLFYVVLLGINPAWIGTLLAVIRLWDALLDPFVGHLSDRLVCRYGRRKPFMLAGITIMVAIFPVCWMAQPDWSAFNKIIWFGGTLFLFSIGYACYGVVYQALGLELTKDHHQRTGLQAFRTFFGSTTNIILWWALPLAFLPIFKSEFQGMVWIGFFIALLILVSGIFPTSLHSSDSLSLHANYTTKISLLRSWHTTTGNRAFILLLGVMGCTFLALNLTISLINLLNVYYVYEGNVASSMVLTGSYGTLWTLMSVAATFVIPGISRRLGKRLTLASCVGSISLGSIFYLFVFNPELPFLQLLPVVFLSPGCAGMWILGPSILADICDDDRIRHGNRREASFSAIYALVQKVSLSVSFAFSSYLAIWAGFDITKETAQEPGVFDTMRILSAIAPILVLTPALFLVFRFPISEKVAQENSRILSGM